MANELTKHVPIVANWIAFNDKEPWLETSEFPLFSDAEITGEMILGPYSFLNTVAAGNLRPAIILRYARHKEWDYPTFEKTDSDLYHGGSPPEELAALASMAMGIRLRAGRSVRRFVPNGDPLGSPQEIGDQKEPIFFIPRAYTLPRVAKGQHSMDTLQILNSLPGLSPSKVNALVRAARLYQDGLWLAESEPEFTWLLFVSALESAANEWKGGSGSSSERLEISKPELYERLASHPDKSLLPLVAHAFADSMGATKKFIDFCATFIPDPPAERPAAEWAQFSWELSTYKKALRSVYNYRSGALHAGRPFPAPMCSPPYDDPSWKAPAERMIAFGSYEGGSTWMAKDIPLKLHCFEYITRATIMRWWHSLLAENAASKVDQ